MAEASQPKLSRRKFLKRTAAVAAGAAAVAGGSYWLGSVRRTSRALGKKVIVIGIDGMDPRLCRAMMRDGLLPNLQRLSAAGGFSDLGTSIPPQSPVAWANFINGAGPGSHGIFDFVHRHPEKGLADEGARFYSAAEGVAGEGAWEVSGHKLPLDFWPFNHTPPTTALRRRGVPFWHYLDQAKIPSTFYDLPCNYPPSPSEYGYHRCISGMGTPDMLGTGFSTYQFFSEDGPERVEDHGGGKHARLVFEEETAKALLQGPDDSFRQTQVPIKVEFLVHRDRQANAAVIEIQGRRIVLKQGEWSQWTKIDFRLSTPWFLPGSSASGICRFYVQEVAPNFRLFVTPVNIDPSNPALKMSEPDSFIKDVSERLGLFYTSGFQEDYFARMQDVFDDDEFIRQSTAVLEERLRLLEYAVENYDDGLLYFYFSSSDLQSHILWWNNDEGEHPLLDTPEEARTRFRHIRELYRKLDAVIGDLADRYGGKATVYVMSDHGFANFGRQFNLNTWLYQNGVLTLNEGAVPGPGANKSILHDVDWTKTLAYGVGINGLYLNRKDRERGGVVAPGEQATSVENVLHYLVSGLESFRDGENGPPVVTKVYRASEYYHSDLAKLPSEVRPLVEAVMPDLVVGYARGYRASWDTVNGELTAEVVYDNDSPWSADHCADAAGVPGVLFCNRGFRSRNPALIDMAPSILEEFGLPTPTTMVGKSIFST